MIRHDIVCSVCKGIESDVWMEPGKFPDCKRCGSATTWVPSRINTDLVRESNKFNRAAEREFTTTREAEKYMKSIGFDQAAGDAVHGARDTGIVTPKGLQKKPSRETTHRAFREAVAKNTSRMTSRQRKALRSVSP